MSSESDKTEKRLPGRLGFDYWVLLIITIVFWFLPGRLEPFQGECCFTTPFSLLAIIAICVLFYLGSPARGRASLILMACLLSLSAGKLLLGELHAKRGLKAFYFAGTSNGLPYEKSIWNPGQQYTRIDRQINFVDAGFSFTRQVFPLYFVNDSDRFSWFRTPAEKKKRRNFRFRAVWQGFLSVDKAEGLELEFSGGDAIVCAGDQRAEGTGSGVLKVPVSSGMIPVRIAYTRNNYERRKLQLRWARSGVAVGSECFSPIIGSYSGNRIVEIVNYIIHGIWLVCFVLMIKGHLCFSYERKQMRERLILSTVFVILIVVAFVSTGIEGLKSNADILTAGDDWHAYVTQARNIVSGDFLDRASTKGEVFYWNVGYRYFLAFLHHLVGESTRMMILVQRIMLYCFCIALYHGIKRLFGFKVALFSLGQIICLGAVLPLADKLLDSSLNIVVSVSALYLLLCYGRKPKPVTLLSGALLLGLGCLLRGNFLLFVPIALIWVVAETRGKVVAKVAMAALFVAVFSLPMSFTAVRNYAVAGEVKFLPSTGSLNVWLGNRPPDIEGKCMSIDNVPEDSATRYSQVVDGIIDYPGIFIKRLLMKCAHLLGYDVRKHRFSIGVFIPTLFALMLICVWRFLKHPRRELLLLMGWVLANYAALIIVFPWGYGWRLMASPVVIVNILSAMVLVRIFDKYRGDKCVLPRENCRESDNIREG